MDKNANICYGNGERGAKSAIYGRRKKFIARFEGADKRILRGNVFRKRKLAFVKVYKRSDLFAFR